MAADRSLLRVVPVPPEGDAPLAVDNSAAPAPVAGILVAALRLAGSDRGAILSRSTGSGPAHLTGTNLSPEEEAACRELARRVWQRPPQSGALPSRLGGSTLIAQPLEPTGGINAGDAARVFVAVIRGGAGKVDTDRLTVLRDVAALLSAGMNGIAAAQHVADILAAERRSAARLLALNQSLGAMAGAEDVAVACRSFLAQLLPQFPGVEYSAVWQLDCAGSQLRRIAALGLPDDPSLPETLPLHAGFAMDAVVETGFTQLLEFAAPRGRTASARLARRLNLVTLIQVPLRSRMAVTGVLSLGARSSRTFTDADRSFLEALGAQLGGQLDAVRELEAGDAERERLRTLIETLPMGIVLYDAGGAVSLWNSASESLLGGRPADIDTAKRTGLPPLVGADGRSLPPDESPVLCAARDGCSVVAQELAIRRPATEADVPVLVTAAPIRDPQGRSGGVIAVYQDITRLREVDRLKDDFINTVSHELRTPTTTVRGGALTLLKRGDQLEPSVRRQLLHDMADEAERLYHLVEDLLSLSRAQAGLRLQLEPMILSRFVNKVILDLGGRVGNHALTVEVPNDLPLIEADPTYLEQVLRNLLENAVKFSPKGKRIELTAEARDPEVLFSVLDRGSGIPAADMDRVFEPFYRTEEAVRTGQQGAGLGLAVSRRLIEVQGGRIWAERRAGGGTAFRFTLPALSEEDE
ncbi:MAG: sensor histidine kinase [Dehalococcoidia bacterium]